MVIELWSASEIARVEGLTAQGVYAAMRRGELLPAYSTRGGRLLFTKAEATEWRRKRAERKAKQGSRVKC